VGRKGSGHARLPESDAEGEKRECVVLSGNNKYKTDFIYESIDAGLNVLADKPMAINSGDFGLLRKAFALAEKRNVLLFDIMTERFEITSILQRSWRNSPRYLARSKQARRRTRPWSSKACTISSRKSRANP